MTLSEESHPKSVHPDRVPFWTIFLIAVGAEVFGGGLAVWAWGELYLREAAFRPDRQFPEQRIGPPRERAGVEEKMFIWSDDARVLHDREAALLRGWGWVDKSRRIVRMPIEDAMRVVAGGDPR
jgi:hypothetical protein